ncbi:MAG: hypothetical protein H8M99_09495, partial [Gloeobacteraceae cyanobacterium ES-bin-144]|nr:hypothetical protein [Verrucomicrobiales bacterium]
MSKNRSSEEIESRLQLVRERIRNVQRMRAAMVIGTIVLGGLIVMMLVDYLFAPLSVGLRWGMFVTWGLGVFIAVWFGFAPIRKPISFLQVARWLEGRHPELQERLSTVLELSHGVKGVSPELLEALGRAAAADAVQVNAEVEVKTARTSHRWTRPAIALLTVIAIVFVIWPGETSRLFVRAVAPFSTMGNSASGTFIAKPGNIEVLDGDVVQIEVEYGGKQKTLGLSMELEDGQKISQEMTKAGEVFRYVMDPAKSGFSYQVRAGRAESDCYKVTVWPVPVIADPHTTMNFPEYTGLLKKESSLVSELAGVSGTQVVLTGKTNTAVESAWLEIGGKHISDAEMESSATGGRLRFYWTLAAGSSGEAVVFLKHRLGRQIEALKFSVSVLEDHAPEVVLLSPLENDLKLRSSEVLKLAYEVTEDFAVAKMAVEVDANGKEMVMLDQMLPLRLAESKSPVFHGAAAIVMGELKSRFPKFDQLRVRVRAEDAKPVALGGPGIGFSQWINLRFDENAESLARQELRGQHDGAMQSIEEAIRDIRGAKEKMDAQREEIKKDELSDSARKALKESAESLATAETKLEELAKQMTESVHASKADNVQKASEDVAKAREEMENLPLQDSAKQREEKLDLAKNEADSAIKQLENAQKAMARDQEKIDELAQIQDLAQQQQELARQAETNLTDSPTAESVPQDWQKQQQQLAEALKQETATKPSLSAEALQAQSEQAKAMAEQAQSLAKAQENLEQQAKSSAEGAPQEALKA